MIPLHASTLHPEGETEDESEGHGCEKTPVVVRASRVPRYEPWPYVTQLADHGCESEQN